MVRTVSLDHGNWKGLSIICSKYRVIFAVYGLSFSFAREQFLMIKTRVIFGLWVWFEPYYLKRAVGGEILLHVHVIVFLEIEWLSAEWSIFNTYTWYQRIYYLSPCIACSTSVGSLLASFSFNNKQATEVSDHWIILCQKVYGGLQISPNESLN